MKKVLLVVSLISVLLLAGCNKEEKVENNVPEVVENQQQEIINNNTDKDNELNDKKRDDLVVMTNYRGFEIPSINLNSDDAKKVNEEIVQFVKEEVDWSIDDLNDSSFQYVHGVGHKYNIDNNVLFVFVEHYGESGSYHEYYTYNFDINTGKLLKNVNIVGQEKADEIMSILPNIYDKYFEDYKAYHENMIDGVDWQEEYKRNQELMPKNIDDLLYYVDEKEGPQIVLELMSIVGPSSVNEIINLNEYLK